jgi:tungstate transport system substrate-binding protein
MYNDFVLVGPKADPARIAGLRDAPEAFRRLAGAGAPFASRGDRSGTHAMELRLWGMAGLASPAGQVWYCELGSGMGPTLNTAASMGAYTLADRGTWLAFKNRGDLAILVEGDQKLFNPYSSLLVNPAKGAHIKAADAKIWHDWLTAPAGLAAIRSFTIEGQPLFFPLAGTPRS